MKKIFYLLMILVSITTQAQISNYELCDTNNDGFETFDLFSKIPEALSGLNPELYDVSFHETIDYAENNTNHLDQYFVNSSVPQTIYVRIENNSDETYTIETFDLILLLLPEIGQPVNLYNPDGIFDLTENSPLILNGSPDYFLTFHVTLTDAETGANAIFNPENYTAISSPQTIYVRVENSNSCLVITNFLLITGENDDIVYIPDMAFKTKLLQATTSNQTAKDINGNNMIVDFNSDGEIQMSEALNVYSLQVYQSNIEDLTGIEAFAHLTYLSCAVNNLTELDVSNNVNLTYLDCNNNNLTELDLSNNSNLETLWAIFNPQLSYLNINNGGNLNPAAVDSGSWMEMWANLPDNIYICADEIEIALIEPQLNLWSATGQMISSYCTFYPQGNYNTITGIVSFDLNNDGICDDNILQSFIKVNITDGVDQNNAFTSQDGTYIFFTQEGEYALTVDVENPTFFNVTPVTETVVFSDNNNNEEVINFCITPNGVHNDLEVVIAPLTPARPGFEATYNIVYRNKGNQILSEDYGLSFFFNQQLMSFVSASVEPDSQIAGGLNWSYENLMPFENREILVTMQVNPPTDPENPVNIDDILTFTSVIMPQNGDENVSDNTYVFDQTVVGAYDPNDITCLEGDIVDPEYIGEELHYVIRFENTGNFYAENVVIAMEVNEELYDVSSLRVLDASHDVRAQVRDNVAEFFFNQIMLDSGGHGNILLVMKSYTALEEGDSVMSKADIYFDYNYPIITNDAVTVFEEELSRDNHELAALISIYPNPATDSVTIASETKIKSVEWYDFSGRLIRISLVNDFSTVQNISSESEGMYFIKIQTEKGVLYHKIIKK